MHPRGLHEYESYPDPDRENFRSYLQRRRLPEDQAASLDHAGPHGGGVAVRHARDRRSRVGIVYRGGRAGDRSPVRRLGPLLGLRGDRQGDRRSPHGPYGRQPADRAAVSTAEFEARAALLAAIGAAMVAQRRCSDAGYGSEVAAGLFEALAALDHVLAMLDGRARPTQPASSATRATLTARAG